MFAYGERKGLTKKWLEANQTMPIEEQYCYALGRMVARFGRSEKWVIDSQPNAHARKRADRVSA
jgi:hypothetical protein